MRLVSEQGDLAKRSYRHRQCGSTLANAGRSMRNIVMLVLPLEYPSASNAAGVHRSVQAEKWPFLIAKNSDIYSLIVCIQILKSRKVRPKGEAPLLMQKGGKLKMEILLWLERVR